MKKLLAVTALSISLLIVSTVVVLAASDTTVSLGWGDLIGAVGQQLVPWAALGFITLVMAILPAPVKVWFDSKRTAQVEQLLERGLGFAASKLGDTVKGQTLSVDVKNKLISGALQYALDHGSDALIKWMGGEGAVPAKLEARLLTSPSVVAAQVGATVGVGVNPVH